MRRLLSIFICLMMAVGFIFVDSNNCYAKKKKKKKSKTPIETIEFQARDGFNIVGKIYISEKATPTSKMPLIILIHSLGLRNSDWKELPVILQKKGYIVYTPDLRGHGKSLQNKYLRKTYWSNFINKEFQAYPLDIEDGITFIHKNYSQVDVNNIIMVGADIGASSAVIAAGNLNKQKPAVKGLALISPIINYKDLYLPLKIVDYGKHPTKVFVSKGDKVSYKDCFEIAKFAQSQYEIKTFPNGGIGQNLIKNKPIVEQDIISFIEEELNITTILAEQKRQALLAPKKPAKKKKKKKKSSTHH